MIWHSAQKPTHRHDPREDTELSRCVPNLPQPGERCREGSRGGSRGGRREEGGAQKGTPCRAAGHCARTCLQIVVARLLDIRHADVEGTICLRGEPVRGRGTCAGNAQRSRAVARRRGRQQSGQAGPRATPEAGLTRTARTDC
eukprot:scaffold129426_cov84-Phaeocystis_antarctica.AAC.1